MSQSQNSDRLGTISGLILLAELIRSSDNDSTGLWPPGSLHTLGADGYI